MPTAFSYEEQKNIRKNLKGVALEWVRTKSVQKITVGELTAAAGISVGAFYKFFSTKEHLFYELLRELHESVYGSAICILLDDSEKSVPEKITAATLAGCKVLDESGMVCFWTEDAAFIMRRMNRGDMAEQTHVENKMLRRLFDANGALKVPFPVVADAIRGLMSTVVLRGALDENYPSVLLWMAEGVCQNIENFHFFCNTVSRY